MWLSFAAPPRGRRALLLAAVLLGLGMPPLDAQQAAPADAPADAQSQDAGPLSFFRSTELSGFVDVYYGYNFNKPGTRTAQLRNFDVQHDSFSLNLVELALSNVPTPEHRGGFRIDLQYGPTASTIHAAEPGSSAVFQHIEQAYVSYLAPAGKGLQLDVGKFVTQHGAEVIETKDNWNYSRSLGFALAIPYYHMGARLSYPFSDKFTLGAVLVNGWNDVVDNNTGKTVGLQATLKPTSSLTIIQNYMTGPEQSENNDDRRELFDTLVMYNPTSRLSLMANYDHGKDRAGGADVTWQGLAGYLRFQPNAWFALTPRVEWYDDPDGFTTGVPQTLKGFTLGAEFKHKDGVLMRVEYRRDSSDVPFFQDGQDGASKAQSTFTVGFVYAFSSKTP